MTRESILESMSSFKLEDAHCYDPNEEIKLRSVMADVGEVRGLDPRAGGQDPVKGQGGGGATTLDHNYGSLLAGLSQKNHFHPLTR